MTWWPVGWSQELGDKPLAVRVGTDELVVFRDCSGAAFAFEDRCPHRRVPLSLGKVTPEGTLQCGYHGWCYDGASGRCVSIPNFRPGEPISARVAVRAYPAAEVRGWLLIETGGTAGGQSEAPPTLEQGQDPSDQQAGKVVVPLSHETWVEWLLTDPVRALGIAETCSLGDPLRLEERDSQIFVSRPIILTPAGERLRSPPRTTGTPLTGRFRVWSGSGLVELIAIDRSQNVVFSLVVASVPLSAGQTSVLWQVRTRVGGGALSRFLAKVRGSPHSLVNIRPDAAAASTRWQAGDVAAAWLELSSRNKGPLEAASAAT